MSGFPRPPKTLTALVDPRLHGAACAGLSPWFDEQIPGESRADMGERHRAAIRICRVCPVIDACGQALLDLPKEQRLGIWAGANAEQLKAKTTRKVIAA